MPRYALMERQALADALLDAGPDAPTLCTGWTARDLAAHVVLRDRRPDAIPGVLIRALRGWTERVQRGYRDGRDYPDLVGLVRHPPRWSPLSLAPLDEAANTLEFFIHTEDVRRGGPDRQPRPLDPGLAALLWRRVPTLARLNLRRVEETVRVEAPGHGAVTIGNGEPTVTITGDPGELVLFFYGRQSAARVDLTGPEELVDRLRRARFGL
ncbi:TIGR03085 family metal-binding protein [Planosporangium mesophilum]|uniref:TIGR03085 family protein n=1 Tax=Planosporangium mesophilum TaxID=689768 RepID=A0A8J3T952_9ACTN|nr:TIGR03085 family metal-binding protein [Planosporangium mesophilum]NJC83605.1 TIGR03085 family protein [Planosporangium mesophilum]GII22118.1 TIGR03085 family protein [Planosporangium mesophilum]